MDYDDAMDMMNQAQSACADASGGVALVELTDEPTEEMDADELADYVEELRATCAQAADDLEYAARALREV